MKDLSTLGFGPPDLGGPEGNCKNGHPWATNVRQYVNSKGKSVRACRTCNTEQQRKAYTKKRAKEHEIEGQFQANRQKPNERRAAANK